MDALQPPPCRRSLAFKCATCLSARADVCCMRACVLAYVRAGRRTTATSFSLSGTESASAHSSPVMCAHVYVAAGVCWPRIEALVVAGGEKSQPEWLCIDMRTHGRAHVTRCQLANWFLSSGLTELTSPL